MSVFHFFRSNRIRRKIRLMEKFSYSAGNGELKEMLNLLETYKYIDLSRKYHIDLLILIKEKCHRIIIL